MKGLMLKDIYVIKDGLLIPILILTILGVVLSALSSPWVLLIIAASSLGMQATMTIPSDKSSQWHKFSATLPVSRAQFVQSKYGMYAILGGLGMLLGGAVTVTATLFTGTYNIETLLMFTFMSVSMLLLPGSVNIPLAFLLSEEQSIVGIIISYVATAGLFVGVTFVISRFMDTGANMLLTFEIIAVFSVIVYLLSFVFCPNLVTQKDI